MHFAYECHILTLQYAAVSYLFLPNKKGGVKQLVSLLWLTVLQFWRCLFGAVCLIWLTLDKWHHIRRHYRKNARKVLFIFNGLESGGAVAVRCLYAGVKEYKLVGQESWEGCREPRRSLCTASDLIRSGWGISSMIIAVLAAKLVHSRFPCLHHWWNDLREREEKKAAWAAELCQNSSDLQGGWQHLLIHSWVLLESEERCHLTRFSWGYFCGSAPQPFAALLSKQLCWSGTVFSALMAWWD